MCEKCFTSYGRCNSTFLQRLFNIESTLRDVAAMFTMFQFNVFEILDMFKS